MDLAGVAACFPGATVTSVEGDRFEGTVKVKLGPIALLYTGSGQFVTRDDDGPPRGHRGEGQGQARQRHGRGDGDHQPSTGRPAPAAVDVVTDLDVTGKPAQFGRGVMQDVSDKLLDAVRRLPGAAAHRSAAGGRGRGGGDRTGSRPRRPSRTGDGLLQRVRAGVGRGGGRLRGRGPARLPPRRGRTSTGRRSSEPVPAATNDDAIDLGSTVLPVILKSYAPHLVAAAVGLVVGILIGRRLRR